jgi:hypothetical protein
MISPQIRPDAIAEHEPIEGISGDSGDEKDEIAPLRDGEIVGHGGIKVKKRPLSEPF